MKIFLSALNSKVILDRLIAENINLRWNLLSFFYIQKAGAELAERVRDLSEEILIDSGAHSFQKGVKVNWDEYTRQYADFIRSFDRPNVLGYFEMDVDNIVGYEKVLELRKILESASDKIIPVWHKNRGIDDYKKMCQDYAGKIIAITGFYKEDIKDEQYLMFLKYARECECKVHCLGMTRQKVLDKVPFDYTDSSTWLTQTRYGQEIFPKRQCLPKAKGDAKIGQYVHNYKRGMMMQEYYYHKWRKACQD